MGSCLLAICALILRVEGEASPLPEVPLKELGLTLPGTIEGIPYASKQEFEGKGLGYSVNYASKGCRISLYAYDREKKDIHDGKGDVVKKELDTSIDELKQAAKGGVVSNFKEMKAPLPLPKAVLDTFASAGFTFELKGGACRSYTLVVGRKCHFLKIRVTQYVVSGKTNDEEVSKFLEAVVKLLAKETP